MVAQVIRVPNVEIEGIPDPPPSSILPSASTFGVVAMFRPGHPLSGKTGVPVTGESFNDIAGEWTKKTLGLTEAPGLAVTRTIPDTSTSAFIERTAKGGIHVASAHSGATTTYQNFIVSLQAARKSYLDTRIASGDKIYVSLWGRLTRPAKAGFVGNSITAGVRKGSNLADLLAATGYASSEPWYWPKSGAGFNGGQASMHGTATFSCASGFTSGAFSTNVNAILLGATNAATLNVLQGEIVYQVYIENLTATGRTHDEVRTKDFAEFTDLVLTPGGQFFGDTWTDPTTKLP